MAFAFGPGIRVNALAPGAILPRTEKDAVCFRRIKERVPLGKEADIESLLEAYAFLVNASSITGQIIYIDCGLHLLAQ
jgi:NAD(P)-dependent dehydrogenase (short-subunit alcohol dehydrogenase family)